MRVAFITSAKLKERSLIHQNVEDSLITPTIQRAQELYIKPLIGSRLYERLVTGIKNSNLNANEITLIEDYLTDALCVSCEIISVQTTSYQIRNKATGQTSDEFLRANTKSQNIEFRDELRQHFEGFRMNVVRYLRKNYNLFPELLQYDSIEYCDFDNYLLEIYPDKGKPHTNLYF